MFAIFMKCQLNDSAIEFFAMNIMTDLLLLISHAVNLILDTLTWLFHQFQLCINFNAMHPKLIRPHPN